MSMEELDYRMELEPSEAGKSKQVLVNKDEFWQKERREAFKQKLRKYSWANRQKDF
jgi:hypothetical protein